MARQKPMPMWLARLTLAALSAFILLVLASVFQDVKSHSWYDYDCCGGRDCAEIADMKMLSGGVRFVKLVDGRAAIFPPDISIRASMDGKRHGCINKVTNLPECLYLPWEV